MSTERISRLLACLPDSNLSAEVQGWLQELFNHNGSIMADLAERDALIRLCVSLSPGQTRTAKCAYFLDCIDGHRDHLSATAQNLLDKLRASGVAIPRSVKQLLRILEGRRQDGWRGTRLCPSGSLDHDGGNLEEIGNERSGTHDQHG